MLDGHIDSKILRHCHLHSRVSVVAHIKEVCHSALPVVCDCREVLVGNVFLLAELSRLNHIGGVSELSGSGVKTFTHT